MMNEKICIAIDSMIDLNRDWAKKNGVKIIPTIVLFDGEYMNAIECDANDVFEYYESHNKELPETRPTTPEMFQEFFIPLIHQGYHVIYLATMPSISLNYANAVSVAEMFPDKITVVDSKSSSVGSVPMVRKTCELVQQGYDRKEILEAIPDFIAKSRCSFIVDDLNFIFENSNVHLASQIMAKVFNVKPSMVLDDGKILPGKKFSGSTEKALCKYIEYTFKDKKDIDDSYLLIGHTATDEKIIQTAKTEISKYVKFKEVETICAGAAISSHLGKGAVMLSYSVK